MLPTASGGFHQVVQIVVKSAEGGVALQVSVSTKKQGTNIFCQVFMFTRKNKVKEVFIT